MAWGMLSPLLCVLAIGIPAMAQRLTITTIDAPGAGTAGGYGTEGIAISPTGEIVGFYAGIAEQTPRVCVLNL